jgi:hypothetical protein
MAESEEIDTKRELARLKRVAMEIASEIHDIVEDTFFVRHNDLISLSEKAAAAVTEYHKYKADHGL